MTTPEESCEDFGHDYHIEVRDGMNEANCDWCGDSFKEDSEAL